MPKKRGGSKSGPRTPDKKSLSTPDTPTPAPKHGLSDRESSPVPKRAKLPNSADEGDSVSGEKPSGRPLEEIMAGMVGDEGSDFDLDSDADEEEKTEEQAKEIIKKIGLVPKRIENLAELRGLLLELPPGQLLGQLKSWTAIIAATPSVGSFPVLKTWLQSELFKHHLLYLLKGYILPQEVETKSRTRGDDFNTVMSIITTTKRRKNRTLHKANVDRSQWEYCDWLASTLHRIFEANESDCDGLFEGSTVSEERKYVIYFAAIRQALSDGSKSRRGRLWSLLAITPEEKEDLLTEFRHLEGTFDENLEGKAARDEERQLREVAKRKVEKMTPVEKKALVKKAKAQRKRNAKSGITKEVRNFTKPESKTDEARAIDELLVKGSGKWKEEFRQTSMAWKELKRTSDKFDIEDPYWADLFLKRALDSLEAASSEAEEDVPYLPDRSLTLAPTMGPQILNLQVEAAFNPNTLVLPETPRKTRRDVIQETQANATPVKRLHEVTDEGAGMYNTLANFLEERNLWNAELDGVDFGEDNKPVNTTSSLIMPDETVQNDLAQIDKALDNQKLQREDIAKAKKAFGIADDADKLNVPGMRISKAATDWQLVAADAMYDAFKDDDLIGMLIADDVGLGKTWSCMTFLLKVYKELSGPIMVVVPPHIIDQWADELFDTTSKFKIWVYYGDGREKTSKDDILLIEKLTRDHEVFKGKNPGKNVIITSYQTIVLRNGLKMQRGWMINQGLDVDLSENALPEPDIAWDRCLQGILGVLVLDEVHQIRNTDTQTFKTMQSLRAHFNILMSATPSFNQLDDVKGMLGFILNPQNNQLWAELDPPEDYDPFADDADPQFQPLLFTMRGLNKWVWKKKGLEAAVALLPVWEKCVIRRTVNSHIPFVDGKPIGENIPPAIRRLVPCRFTAEEQRQYNLFAAPPLANLIDRREGGGCVWRMDQFRMLTLLNVWIGTQYVHQTLIAKKASNMAQKIDKKGTLGKLLAHKALEVSQQVLTYRIEEAEIKGEATKGLVDGIRKVPKDAKDVDRFSALCTLLHGAPKLREMMKRIRLEVHHLHEKSIVWCSNPGQQFLAAGVLNLAGISCAVYHAELTSAQRRELLKAFNESSDPMVLVCSYYVNSAGSNMQHQCRNVHLLCTPMGMPIAAQAIGRVRRLGQTRIVKVYEYHLEKSFDQHMISNNISKAMPALALSLNDTNWNFQLDPKTGGGVKMDPYLLNWDGTISEVDEVWFPYLNKSDYVTPEALLALMLRAQSDSKAFRRPKDRIPDAIAKLLSWYKPHHYPENCKTVSDIYELPPEELVAWLEKITIPDEASILEEQGENLDTQV